METMFQSLEQHILKETFALVEDGKITKDAVSDVLSRYLPG